MGKKDKLPPVSSETLEPGDGSTFPADGDTLTVHYTGTLLADGSEFDSSRAKNVPFNFVLGAGKVIKGWELGLAAMSLGQRCRLTISAEAGYGKRGCQDKANASGTGVIPPQADLIFDVALLDINDQRGVATEAKLGAYAKTLDEWVAGKMAKFDADAEFAAAKGAKHGGREGWKAFLEGSRQTKYEAEKAKATQARQEKARSGQAAKAAAPAGEAGRGGEEARGGKEEQVELKFDNRFASIKVEPKPDEARDSHFPRNLHNGAELLGATGHLEAARTLHAAVTRLLETLEQGPTGREAQRMGRACVCWACGHVGLPRNADEVSAEPGAAAPAGVCAACGDGESTNFVRVRNAQGATVPWMEAPPKAAAAAAGAEAAAAPTESQGAA